MATLDHALTGLSEDEVRRVLQWSLDKFGGQLAVRPSTMAPSSDGAAPTTTPNAGVVDDAATVQHDYERLSDLWDAASPARPTDHVLVASYWFQVVQGQDHITGQQVNTELKNHGHGAANITEAFSALIRSNPALARQIEKSGRSKQARKKYRLTTAGVRRVEQMIAGAEIQ